LFSISIHSAPVHIIRYNPIANVTVSIDERGMMEYWSPNEDSDKGYGEPNPEFVSWKYKSDTDLYEFKKNRIRPSCFQFSPDFQKFVTFEFKDRQYRLFNFRTGKITKKIDESLEVITKNQEDPDFPYRLEEMEFGRRLAIEKEIEKSQVGQSMTCNAGSV
jgi:peptidylprolyl isomerase domain and WD repeat-containing protein 1